MANLNLMGWIDVYDLACSLRSRVSQFQGTGVRALPLRGPRKDADPDDEYGFVDSRQLAKWPELGSVIRKIDDAATARIGGSVEFGRIFLEMLDPGAHTPLRKDTRPYAARHVRLVVGVRANPGCWLWCPPEQLGVLPGQVVLTQATLLHAAVNLGDTPRVHLIIDCKQKIATPTPLREDIIDEAVRFATAVKEEAA